jgi:hypothetical protein
VAQSRRRGKSLRDSDEFSEIDLANWCPAPASAMADMDAPIIATIMVMPRAARSQKMSTRMTPFILPIPSA